MNCFWTTIVQHIAANAEAYGVGGIAVSIAAVKCMPKPGANFSWLTMYTWLFDTLQTVIPAPRSSQTVPTPPVAPAQPPTVK